MFELAQSRIRSAPLIRRVAKLRTSSGNSESAILLCVSNFGDHFVPTKQEAAGMADKTVLRIVVASLLALGGFGAFASPAGAQDQQESCSFTALGETPRVEWSSLNLAAGERVTVERQAMDRYWWRGTSDRNHFVDGPAPKGAASLSYRLAIRSTGGATIRHIECSLSTASYFCSAIEKDTGYEIRLQKPIKANEYVVRRQVEPGGAMHWRKLVTVSDGSFHQTYVDGPSPTGTAAYEIWTREDGVILSGATCQSVAPNPCAMPFAGEIPFDGVLRLLNPRLSDAERTDLGITARSAYPGPDGNIYFVRPGDQLVRLNPATGEEEILAELEQWLSSEIRHIDAAGGVYLDQWGGGSRSSQQNTVGVIDPASHFSFDGFFDGTEATHLLPDGRTLRSTGYTDPTPEEKLASGEFAYDPFTGVSTRLTALGPIWVVRSLPDGRLIGRSGIDFKYVEIDYACLLAEST